MGVVFVMSSFPTSHLTTINKIREVLKKGFMEKTFSNSGKKHLTGGYW